MLGATVFHSRTSMPFLQGTTLQNPSLATEESIMNLHFHLLSKKNLKILLSMCFFSHHHIFTKKKKHGKSLYLRSPISPMGPISPIPGLQGLGAGRQRGHVCQEVKGDGMEIQRPLVSPFHWRDPQQLLATAHKSWEKHQW